VMFRTRHLTLREALASNQLETFVRLKRLVASSSPGDQSSNARWPSECRPTFCR
jgi:hypothetical protein